MANAFSSIRTSQIDKVIGRLQHRLINSYKPDFTVDEMFELYTRPEDRDVLTRVFELVNLGSMNVAEWKHNVNVGSVTANLRISVTFDEKDTKWMVPRYAMHGPQLASDSPLRTKFDKWLEKRVAIGMEASMIGAVFHELNWRCTAAGLAFYMPSIIDILGMVEGVNPKLAEQIEKLSTASVPALPVLPVAMTKCLEGVKIAVAKARLLDKSFEETSSDSVRLSFSVGVNTVSPWGTSFILV